MKPQTKTSEEPLAWEEMVVVEPRLARLLSDIQAIKDPGGPKGFCANYHWVTNLKPTFVRLVGFQARGEDARLRTMEAYDLAYQTLYAALPDCRDCGCG
jgi:hypothetical protein